PDIGTQRHFDAVNEESLLPNLGRSAGRRRRKDRVIVLEQSEYLLAIPTAEDLGFVDQARWHHGARNETVTHRRIEIVCLLSQAAQMERGALACGNDIGSRAGAMRLRDVDLLPNASRPGDARQGLQSFRKGTSLEIAAGDGDAQAIEPAC